MRELKFRAWLAGGMTTPLNPVWFEENNWMHDDLAKCVADEGGALMQYTGLRDKNGVEIYEGDILAILDPGVAGVDRGVVKWDADRLGFIVEARASITPPSKLDKVIGNIYENPEQL